MKNLLIICFMIFFGLTGIQAQTVTSTVEAVEQSSQDRVKISPKDIPQPVKTSITQKADVKDLRITEAYQVTTAEGDIHYEVYFDNGTDVVTKKFDSSGKEVKEDFEY